MLSVAVEWWDGASSDRLIDTRTQKMIIEKVYIGNNVFPRTHSHKQIPQGLIDVFLLKGTSSSVVTSILTNQRYQ